MIYSDTFLQIFSPFWLPTEKMLSSFAIRHPGQGLVPMLIYDKTPLHHM
jgi:hypothetical protein